MSICFDTAYAHQAASNAAKIKAAGYESVGMYYFTAGKTKQLLDAPTAFACAVAGVKCWSVWQNGPTPTVTYFTAAQGDADANAAGALARAADQPGGTVIYFAVDYDAAQADLVAITSYFAAVQSALGKLPRTYTAGVYGSGRVCQQVSSQGLVSHTWLANAPGWAGHANWLPQADIVQDLQTQFLGFDIDPDEVRGNYGAWVPETFLREKARQDQVSGGNGDEQANARNGNE